MARYYAFISEKHRTFCKVSSLQHALEISGDEKKVFRHVDGIPNPWWVYRIKNGKADKTKILKDVPKKFGVRK